MSPATVRPLRALISGVLAGAAGTLAMDLVWYARSRREGGTQTFGAWETADGLTKWDDAPAPGQVGRLVAKHLLGRDLPTTMARPVTNVVHWATGIGWGMQYGLLAARTGHRSATSGVAFAPVVWLSGYVLLAPVGIYKPIWQYDTKTLTKDLSAHLAYGAALGAAFRALT